MRIIAKRALRQFWEKHPRSKAPLILWYQLASKADWTCWADVKEMFGSADSIGDNRIIFDIGGNKNRLVVRVSYSFKAVMIKFVGTHADYDRIDPEEVQ